MFFKNEMRRAGCSIAALVMVSIPGAVVAPFGWSTQSSPGASASASLPTRTVAPIASPQPVVARIRRTSNFGIASWYGAVLNGHRTASGEIFDMNRFTAAHRTLPFGTMVRVVDTHSGKSVIVRINDRGVLFSDRVIDLSRAAADQLGIRRSGITSVRLEVLSKKQAADAEIATAKQDESVDLRGSLPREQLRQVDAGFAAPARISCGHL